MNAYFCRYSEEIRIAVYEDWFVNAGHWEWYVPTEVIYAETRGQARADFCKEHHLEYIDPKIHIRKLQYSGEHERGSVSYYSDPIWAQIDPEWYEWNKNNDND